MGLQSLIKIGGFKSYQIAVIVANQVMKVLLGRGLSLAANATLTRALSSFFWSGRLDNYDHMDCIGFS